MIALKNLDNSMIKQLAQIVSKIHRFDVRKLKLPIRSRNFEVDEILDYRDKFRRFVKDKKFFEMYNESIENIKKEYALFSKKKRRTLNHSDVQVGNILITKSGIKLIDWEFMYLGDPVREIAYIFVDFGRIFTEGEKQIFYKNYLKVDENFKEDIKIYEKIRYLEGVYWALWHVLKIKNGLMQEEYVRDTSVAGHVNFAKKLFGRAIRKGVIDRKYEGFDLDSALEGIK